MELFCGTLKFFMPLRHQAPLCGSLQRAFPKDCRRTERGAENERAGRTNRDQPDPGANLSPRKHEKSARGTIQQQPCRQIAQRNMPPDHLEPAAQDADGQREMQDVRAGQVRRMAQCLFDLILERGDIEPGNGRHEGSPIFALVDRKLGKLGVGDDRDVRVLVEMFGQVGERRPAFHLNGRAVDDQIEPRRVARLGETDVMTFGDELVHDQALGRVSAQRPFGARGKEFSGLAGEGHGIAQILGAGKIGSVHDIPVERRCVPEHFSGGEAQGRCRVHHFGRTPLRRPRPRRSTGRSGQRPRQTATKFRGPLAHCRAIPWRHPAERSIRLSIQQPHIRQKPVKSGIAALSPLRCHQDTKARRQLTADDP